MWRRSAGSDQGRGGETSAEPDHLDGYWTGIRLHKLGKESKEEQQDLGVRKIHRDSPREQGLARHFGRAVNLNTSAIRKNLAVVSIEGMLMAWLRAFTFVSG
jgi:hypothetical protein